jgi:hypothetical protein
LPASFTYRSHTAPKLWDIFCWIPYFPAPHI